jgi:hypothetical protein
MEWFLVLQPVLDFLTGVFPDAIGSFSIGAVVRLGTVAYLFLRLLKIPSSQLKKWSLISIGVILVYGVFHLGLVSLDKGLTVLVAEANQLTKAFYFPILLILVVNLWKGPMSRIWTIFAFNAVLISVGLLIPLIGGFARASYEYGKLGWVGLFFSPNEIGAIIVLLFPIAAWTWLQSKSRFLGVGVVVLMLVAGISIGTKVPLVGFVISLVVLIPLLIKHNKGQLHFTWRQGIVIASVSLLLVNYAFWIHSENFRKQTAQFLVIVVKDQPKDPGPTDPGPTDPGPTDPGPVTPKPQPSQLERLFNVVFSSRDRYIVEMQSIMNEEDAVSWMFGLGFIDTRQLYKHSNTLTIEVDVADLFYNYGIIGFSIYSGVIGLILGIFTKKKQIRYGREPHGSILGLTLLLMAGISVFAGHVLTAPAVSVYVAVVLVMAIRQGEDDASTG